MKYIETLREGERIAGVYLCKFCQQALTKNGKAYLNVILQDRTGTIDAKVWDPNSQGIDDFEALDYIDVMGDVTSFMNALQVNVKRVRKAREGEYDPKDYLPVSSKDIEQMYEDLKKDLKASAASAEAILPLAENTETGRITPPYFYAGMMSHEETEGEDI